MVLVEGRFDLSDKLPELLGVVRFGAERVVDTSGEAQEFFGCVQTVVQRAIERESFDVGLASKSVSGSLYRIDTLHAPATSWWCFAR